MMQTIGVLDGFGEWPIFGQNPNATGAGWNSTSPWVQPGISPLRWREPHFHPSVLGCFGVNGGVQKRAKTKEKVRPPWCHDPSAEIYGIGFRNRFGFLSRPRKNQEVIAGLSIETAGASRITQNASPAWQKMTPALWGHRYMVSFTILFLVFITIFSIAIAVYAGTCHHFATTPCDCSWWLSHIPVRGKPVNLPALRFLIILSSEVAFKCHRAWKCCRIQGHWQLPRGLDRRRDPPAGDISPVPAAAVSGCSAPSRPGSGPWDVAGDGWGQNMDPTRMNSDQKNDWFWGFHGFKIVLRDHHI